MIEGRISRGEPVKSIQVLGEPVDLSLINDPPDIMPAARPYLSAFFELTGQRHIDGMGAIGEIRREAVTDWLDENAVEDRSERERFRSLIGVCDRAYIGYAHERREREQRKAERAAKRVGGKG